VEDAGVYFGELQTPHRYSHKGFLELSKRYISWYKNGVDPGIKQDALFYFYRVHATNMVASTTSDIPVTWWYGTAKDSVFATALLTAPAQLLISSGTKTITNSLPAGMSQCEMPFSPGPQIFKLSRNGKQLLTLQGPDVLSRITNYDFFPASGFVYATNTLPPPSNLKVISQ
jgi:glucan endo-1,3-alpha-glucosidase